MRRATNSRTYQLESIKREAPPTDPGFIKFYGLYWSKHNVDWKSKHLLGRPKGWMGQGKTSEKHSDLQMNFWKQKGVYILYDANLHPISESPHHRQNLTGATSSCGDREIW